MLRSTSLLLSLALAATAIAPSAWASKPRALSGPPGIRSGARLPISDKLAFVAQPNDWSRPVLKSRLPNGTAIGTVQGYFTAKLDGRWWRLNFLPGPGLRLFSNVTRVQLNDRLAFVVQREQSPPLPSGNTGIVQGYFVGKIDGRWWRLVSLAAPAWFPQAGAGVSIGDNVAFVVRRELPLPRSGPSDKVGTAVGYFVAKVHGDWWVLDTTARPSSFQTAVRTRGD